jgi:predicted nucleic acid-binding protein
MRICVDLNVWVSDQLAFAGGRSDTSASQVVNAVNARRFGSLPLQLVMSMQMLDNLRVVLVERVKAGEDSAVAFIDAIEATIRTGPDRLDPYLIMGGAAKFALSDREDREVLATAFAGEAELLVTSNLKHFRTDKCEVVETTTVKTRKGPRQLHAQIHTSGDRWLIVADPINVADWIRRGIGVDPSTLRNIYTPSKKHGI